MALPVSSKFLAAQTADSNQVAYQVQLLLGNYANPNVGAVASSSGDFSTDYPAAGAINGDRTEINIGPASGADNAIGLASWKSSGIPSNGDSVWWVVDFGATRTVNRMKFYHRSGHGMSAFKVEYWDGSAWQPLAQFNSAGPASISGYGDSGFGTAPYGDPSGLIGVVTTMTLDTFDFPDTVMSKVRITPTETQVVGEHAELVEFEAYRKVDISSRVTDVQVDRHKDFKLNNNLAATFQIDADNSDRFFSPSHVPSAAEVAAGFVNSELRPGLGVLVSLGFAYGGGSTELASSFVGTVDTLNIQSLARKVIITGRDGMKDLFNLLVSTKLKTAQDIGTNVQYLLNLANVSNYEMTVDTTGISLDYFFVDDNSVVTAIQNLVEACGDAAFFYDENGIATFRMYLSLVPQSKVFTTQADWQGGTLESLDAVAVAGQVTGALKYTSGPTPSWFGIGSGSAWSGELIESGSGAVAGESRFASTQAYGYWEVRTQTNAGLPAMWFIWDSASGNGYSIDNDNAHIHLYKNATLLGTYAFSGGGQQTVAITRSATGLFSVYIGGVLKGTVTDNTYTTSTDIRFLSPINAQGIWTKLLVSTDTGGYNAFDILLPTWISPTIDRSALVSGGGAVVATHSNSGSTAVALVYTSSSSDGVSWSAWAPLVGGADVSPVNRYLMVMVVLPNCFPPTYTETMFDLTVNWATSGGTAKNHATADFAKRWDGDLIELEQEFSDNLGGDTAIVNDAQVTSAPLVLTGATTDTRWQATTGSPAVPVSAGSPLSLSAGTYFYSPIINGGMDVSLMTGANPAAVAITFGTGAGSWSITSINPTRPVVKIVVTSGGNITDFRMVGKQFANSTTPYAAEATDAASIALYNKRVVKLSNNFIINSGIALAVATRLVLNFKAPVNYIPKLTMNPLFSAQIGDRITLVDYGTDINGDYTVVGLTQTVSATVSGAQAETAAVLIKI